MTVSSVNVPIKPFGNTRFCGRGHASGRTHTMCQELPSADAAASARFEPVFDINREEFVIGNDS